MSDRQKLRGIVLTTVLLLSTVATGVPSVTAGDAGNATIAGHVGVANGADAPPSTIRAVDASTGASDQTATDAGNYSVDVPADGTYELVYVEHPPGETAFPDDGVPDVYAVGTTGAPATQNVTLPVGHDLSVRVVDQSGAAVENATVAVVHLNSDADVSVDGTTNATGATLFGHGTGDTLEVAGDVVVAVQTPDRPTLGDNQTRVTVTDRTTLTLTVDRNVNVSGRVTNASGGNVTVGTVGFENESLDVAASTPVDADGTFRVGVEPNTTYAVTYNQRIAGAPLDGYPDAAVLTRVPVADGGDVGSMTVPDAYRLNVTVVNGTTPLPNASVAIVAGGGDVTSVVSGHTDSNGRVVVGETVGVEVVGPVRIYVEHPQTGVSETWTYDATGDANVTVNWLDSNGGPVNGTPVRGRVVDADGAAVATGFVPIVNASSREGYGTLLNDTGGFYDRIPPNGTYAFGFRQTDFDGDGATYPLDGVPDVAALGTVDVGTEAVDLSTVALPAGHRLNVTVTRDGAPVSNATVRVYPNEAGSYVSAAGETRRDGLAVFGGTPGVEVNGTVSVLVRGPHGLVEKTEVTVSQDDSVEVSLPPRTTGRWVGPNGEPLADRAVEAYSFSPYEFARGQTNATGAFVLAAPDGEYRVHLYQLRTGDGIVDVPARTGVALNGSDLGTFRAARGYETTLNVVGEDGDPVDVYAGVLNRNGTWAYEYADGRDLSNPSFWNDVQSRDLANGSHRVWVRDSWTNDVLYEGNVTVDGADATKRIVVDRYAGTRVGDVDGVEVARDLPVPYDAPPERMVEDGLNVRLWIANASPSTSMRVTESLPDGYVVNDTVGVRVEGSGTVSNVSHAKGTLAFDVSGDVDAVRYVAEPAAAGDAHPILHWSGEATANGATEATGGEDVFAADRVTLTVDVTEPDGGPAAGDTVEVYPGAHSGDREDWAHTNASGEAALAVEPGTTTEVQYYQYRENETAEGFTPTGEVFPNDGVPDVYSLGNVTLSGDARAAYALPRAYEVNVTVRWTNGTPVEGAEVSFTHHNGSDEATYTAHTGADGRPVVAGAPDGALELAGDVTVEVDAPAGATVLDAEHERDLYVSEWSGKRNLTVEFAPARTVSGSVTYANGTAVDSGWVYAPGENFTRVENGTYSVTVSEDSTPPLYYLIPENASAPDGFVDVYRAATLTADQTSADLTLPRGSVVNVTVVNATGAPVEDALVSIHAPADADYPLGLPTNTNGHIRDDGTGLELAGDIRIAARPPAGSTAFVDANATRTLTVSENTSVTLQLVERWTNERARVAVTAPAEGAYANDSSVTLTYEVSNAVRGVDHLEYVVDGGAPRTVPAENGSAALSGLADGEHAVAVYLVDERGDRIARSTANFTVDTTAPTADLTANGTPASAVEPATFEVAAADANLARATLEIRGVDAPVLVTRNVTDAVADGPGAVAWNATVAGDPVPTGTYEATLVAVDRAGHETTANVTIRVDNAAPTVDATGVGTAAGALSSPAGQTVRANETVVVAADANGTPGDARRVVAVFRSERANYRETVPATLADGEWTATADVSTFELAGPYAVSLVATDAGGNVNRTAVNATVRVDRSAPALYATVKQASNDAARVQIDANESLASAPRVTVRHDGSVVATTTATRQGEHWQAAFDLSGSGEYAVQVRASDRAGNVGRSTTVATVRTNVTTVNRTVHLVNPDTGAFVTLRTDEPVSGAFAALTASNDTLASLSPSVTASGALDGELAAALSSNLTSATVGIPVDRDALPPGIEPGDVSIRYYNPTSGEWEVLANETRVVSRASGDYYVVNVTHFSTYGAVAVDDVAPAVTSETHSPAGGPYAPDVANVTVEFAFDDAQTGVNASAVSLAYDGATVTAAANATVTDEAASYVVADPAPGTHEVTVTVVDRAGNAVTVTETFTVESPTDGDGDGGGFAGSPSDDEATRPEQQNTTTTTTTTTTATTTPATTATTTTASTATTASTGTTSGGTGGTATTAAATSSGGFVPGFGIGLALVALVAAALLAGRRS